MAAASIESELQSLFMKGGLVAVVQRAKAVLENVESTTLNIAVIGESGGGKSSFVSLLGASGIKGHSALTAGKEPQMEPVQYQFSSDDKVSIWDVPGTQTVKSDADAYLNSLTFDKYHFFIVLGGAEFEETAWQLTKKIREKKKKCYFVRNKLDSYLESEKQREESQYDETKALEHLRNTFVERSKKEGLEPTQIFLISSLHRDKFDFEELQRTLKEELPALKKTIRSHVLDKQISLLTSLIDKKKDGLLAETWKIAAAAASSRVMSIPGASFVCDIPLLLYNISSYRSSFGLDPSVLVTLASMVGEEFEYLKAELQSAFSQEITVSRISQELLQMAGEEIVQGTILEFVPLIGQGISAKRAYSTINGFLGDTVRKLAEDSKRIIKKVLMLDD
ncbi:interferon-gamma-inducible GTPase 10-like [Mobula birostris]|uniref:interferon-gamma-inducible GTPase 10-like n=1 Tax=Mobula birostris TaxID=1983395 RepID=UPI003B286AE5